MNENATFLVKVIGLSAVLSLLIKYGGPLLPIATEVAAEKAENLDGLATAIVILPSLIIGVILLIALKSAAPKKSS